MKVEPLDPQFATWTYQPEQDVMKFDLMDVDVEEIEKAYRRGYQRAVQDNHRTSI